MSDSPNPWISQPAEPEVTPPQPTEVAAAQARGPVAPQRGVRAPDHIDRLPVLAHARPAPLWWVGVHGGAGESTLASLVPTWPAAGHAWPYIQDASARVMLVARFDARGLRAAQTAATQWAAGLLPHIELLGLVLMADAPGRPPKALRELAHVVGGGIPRLWTVPWIASLRLGDPLTLSTAPREVRRLVDELTVLVNRGAPRTTNRKELS